MPVLSLMRNAGVPRFIGKRDTFGTICNRLTAGSHSGAKSCAEFPACENAAGARKTLPALASLGCNCLCLSVLVARTTTVSRQPFHQPVAQAWRNLLQDKQKPRRAGTN